MVRSFEDVGDLEDGDGEGVAVVRNPKFDILSLSAMPATSPTRLPRALALITWPPDEEVNCE